MWAWLWLWVRPWQERDSVVSEAGEGGVYCVEWSRMTWKSSAELEESSPCEGEGGAKLSIKEVEVGEEEAPPMMMVSRSTPRTFISLSKVLRFDVAEEETEEAPTEVCVAKAGNLSSSSAGQSMIIPEAEPETQSMAGKSIMTELVASLAAKLLSILGVDWWYAV